MMHFGALGVHMRHVITYSLSPFEQRVFAGMFSRGIPNIIRRFSEEVFFILPGLGTAAVVYHFGTKDFERRKRKNPADYENEE
jgi:ubiquinol-cytochrome c reductase subunit 8